MNYKRFWATDTAKWTKGMRIAARTVHTTPSEITLVGRPGCSSVKIPCSIKTADDLSDAICEFLAKLIDDSDIHE